MTLTSPAPIVAQTVPARTPSQRRRPLVTAPAAVAALVDVEGDLFGASIELIHQRDDLREAAGDENNKALRRALRALDEGDVSLARDLIRAALFAEDAEDAAIRRAEQRRDAAHGHQKAAAGRVERLVSARGQG